MIANLFNEDKRFLKQLGETISIYVKFNALHIADIVPRIERSFFEKVSGRYARSTKIGVNESVDFLFLF